MRLYDIFVFWMRDFLSDVLNTCDIKSAVYFKETFNKPWGMAIDHGPFAQFHVITRGHCQLRSRYLKQDVTLESGDVVLCIRGAQHRLMDEDAISCLSGINVMTTLQRGEKPFPGEVPGATLVCGHFELGSFRNHPFIEQLPEILVLTSDQYSGHSMIPSLLPMIIQEQNSGQAGSDLLSNKLAETLLIAVLRHHYLTSSPINMISDKHIYQALNYMHQQVHSHITVTDIARNVGISRTLFIDRFKKAVGDTPRKYLNRWRLVLAGKMLKEGQPMDRVAAQVGYQSETAFSRAFKRQYQQSPGRFRRSHST